MDIRKGQVLTLKPEFLDAGEDNLPHVALEDSDGGRVRVQYQGPTTLRFVPVNVWRTDWIATAVDL
jgi:hypothetical protein